MFVGLMNQEINSEIEENFSKELISKFYQLTFQLGVVFSDINVCILRIDNKTATASFFCIRIKPSKGSNFMSI